ncbi:RabGAP, partial [Acrasis kona]
NRHVSKLDLSSVQSYFDKEYSHEPNSYSYLINNKDVEISISHNCRIVAISMGSKVVILRTIDEENQKIYPIEDVCDFDGERVTSLQWAYIHHPKSNSKRKDATHFRNVLLVGSSEGYFRIFSIDGERLFEQRFHTAPLLKIKIESYLHFSRLPDHQFEGILLIYSTVVTRIEGRSFSSFIRKHVPENEVPSKPFNYVKWSLNGQDQINDVVTCAENEVSAFDIFKTKSPFVMLGAGKDPIFACYNSDNHNAHHQPSNAAEIATRVATKVSSAVFGFAKNFLWGSGPQSTESLQQNNSPT